MNLRKTIFRVSLVISWFVFTYLVFLDHTTDISYLKHEVGVFLGIVFLLVIYTRPWRAKKS